MIIWSALSVGSVFFPLDEKLGLGCSSLSPSLADKLVRLSSHLPFRVAVELLADFFGVGVSWETARRLCEGAGKTYCEYQSGEVERLEREMPVVGEKWSHLQVSVDGAMVGLVGGEWAEVKTMAIGAVHCASNEKGELVTQCRELSYFSRLLEAEHFGKQALVETHRRGLSESAKVSAVMDGAEWLQGFVDLHCPKATRILDFPHAAQRVSGIGEAVWGAGSSEAKTWLAHKLYQLKHTGLNELLSELEQLELAQPDHPLLGENLKYLKKRQSQIEYRRFRAEGHPIGSGIVESANKLVMQARLKGSGMHWQRGNVNAMLALRNLECNGRWQEGWSEIERPKKQMRLARRQEQWLVKQAAQVLAIETSRLSQGEQATSPSSSPILSQPTRAAYTGKPAADHPWRKAKIGRAKFNLAKAS